MLCSVRLSHCRMHAGLDVEPGYLHLDSDGRVLRLDTFSKILAPGLRLGWATGTPATLAHLRCAPHAPTSGPFETVLGVLHTR